MGDAYAKALGEGIKGYSKGLAVLNLANNRLTDKGAIPLLKYLKKSEIVELDLSFNPLIGVNSY